jgi:hypothetical protein
MDRAGILQSLGGRRRQRWPGCRRRGRGPPGNRKGGERHAHQRNPLSPS